MHSKLDDKTESISLTSFSDEVKPPETVEVVAPSNLPEGYALKCMLEGKAFNVIVPAGGVKTGELFEGVVQLNPHNIPHRRWRDGTCDCCLHGACHPCWLAWICSFLALGQIQTRMSLNICGGRSDKSFTENNSFLYMGLLTVTFIVGDIVYSSLFSSYWEDVKNPENERLLEYIGVWGYNILIFLCLVFAIMYTRAAIRRKYKIPGTCCEDFCCTLCCTCCTLSQMARHTYDYGSYPVECCSKECCLSKTGMSPSAPKVV